MTTKVDKYPHEICDVEHSVGKILLCELYLTNTNPVSQC